MNFEQHVVENLSSFKLLDYDSHGFFVKARYGPSKPIRIPRFLNENLACFVAAVIGDGHLSKNKALVRIDGFDNNLMKKFKEVSEELFSREFNIYDWIDNGKRRYCLRIDNTALYRILIKIFDIPKGKKSNIVRIPKYIKQSNSSIKSAFLIGILLTEGGKRRRGFGLSTSSKNLWRDLISIFDDINLKISKDKWVYKKYNKEYYGISFIKKRIYIITECCKDKKLSDFLLNYKSFGQI